MNSAELFKMAIGLQTPWEITDINFKKANNGKKELIIQIDFAKGE